jgi:hypothetical protein
MEYTHTLTNDEIANGIVIKLTTTTSSSGTGGAGFANTQTVIEGS